MSIQEFVLSRDAACIGVQATDVRPVSRRAQLRLMHQALLACVACVASSGLLGCSPPDANASASAPAVTVTRPVRKDVIEWDEPLKLGRVAKLRNSEDRHFAKSVLTIFTHVAKAKGMPAKPALA